MARIPLVPPDLESPKEIVDAVRKRRGGELSELDRLLLHSPAFTEGYNFFLGKVRNNLTTIPKLRELAMCTVAVVNQADYEYNAHLPLFVAAGGSSEQGDEHQEKGKAPNWAKTALHAMHTPEEARPSGGSATPRL